MKNTLALSAALATVLASLASPAFAAPKHRAPVAADTHSLYGQPMASQAEIVTGSGSHVIADPDPNIRTQLLRDPDPSGF
jgi:uncharacterized membrane protein